MSERPYQPFYKPYGMTDEEYEYEKRIAAEKLAEWEQEQNESNLLDTQVMPTLAGKPRIIYKNSRHLKEDKPYGIRDNGGYLFFFVDISHYDGQDERYEEELKQQQLLAEYTLAELSKCSA